MGRGPKIEGVNAKETHHMGEGEDAQAGSPVVGEEISGCWSFFIYVITLFLRCHSQPVIASRSLPAGPMAISGKFLSGYALASRPTPIADERGSFH